MAVEISRRLFTVHDYHRMVDAGIVEMADSSLDYDQQVKMELYAEKGVPEYWIADIQNDCVITYSSPDKTAYRSIETFQRNSVLTPRLLPECRIPVDALLP